MGDLVGDKIFDKYGIEFPILIKFIDANDDLSIQVHPNDQLARVRHNSYGKTEMWYVINADNDASLISGFNHSMTKEEYLENLNNNSLTKIVNRFHVTPGDVFYIPAGRIHAIGAGILLAEIQQTSDITYRLYDWGRTDQKGKSRELHTELALDAIDYNYYNDIKTDYTDKINQVNNLVKCDFFTTNKIKFDSPVERDYIDLDSFVIYMCCNGKFDLVFNDAEKLEVVKGETILLPATIKYVRLIPAGEAEVLEVHM
jgi:mannose-6-phosphate isomerase